jgi:hypothetical protein
MKDIGRFEPADRAVVTMTRMQTDLVDLIITVEAVIGRVVQFCTSVQGDWYATARRRARACNS